MPTSYCSSIGRVFPAKPKAFVWQSNDRYDADDYHLGLFVQRRHMEAELLGYLGYAHQEYTASRYVTILNENSQHYTGNTTGDSFFASLEIATPRRTTTGLVVRPLLGMDYLLTAQNGYNEKGGIYALNYNRATYNQMFLRTGIHLKKETCFSSSVLRLQYVYEALGCNAPESGAKFASVNGSPLMNVRGVNPGRHYLNAGAGLNLFLNGLQTRRLGADYGINVGKRTTEHAVSLIYADVF